MKKVIKFLIKVYQKGFSWLSHGCCRYYPSCSQYALEAVEVHGALKGSFLAIKRILRCNPLFPGGYDPVPPKKQVNKK